MNTDDAILPELTRRQEEILSCIVRAYTDSPEPISSKALVEKFNLPFSSATIRNEMVVLDELDYITSAHTPLRDASRPKTAIAISSAADHERRN